MSEMAAKKNECSLGCVQAIRMAQSNPEILKKYTAVINADPADFSVQTKYLIMNRISSRGGVRSMLAGNRTRGRY